MAAGRAPANPCIPIGQFQRCRRLGPLRKFIERVQSAHFCCPGGGAIPAAWRGRRGGPLNRATLSSLAQSRGAGEQQLRKDQKHHGDREEGAHRKERVAGRRRSRHLAAANRRGLRQQKHQFLRDSPVILPKRRHVVKRHKQLSQARARGLAPHCRQIGGLFPGIKAQPRQCRQNGHHISVAILSDRRIEKGFKLMFVWMENGKLGHDADFLCSGRLRLGRSGGAGRGSSRGVSGRLGIGPILHPWHPARAYADQSAGTAEAGCRNRPDRVPGGGKGSGTNIDQRAPCQGGLSCAICQIWPMFRCPTGANSRAPKRPVCCRRGPVSRRAHRMRPEVVGENPWPAAVKVQHRKLGAPLGKRLGYGRAETPTGALFHRFPGGATEHQEPWNES